MTSKDGEFVQYKREWTDYDAVKTTKQNIQDIKVALEAAVHTIDECPYEYCFLEG
jgi:asparagine synthase (glutamine-hydrolysing)